MGRKVVTVVLCCVVMSLLTGCNGDYNPLRWRYYDNDNDTDTQRYLSLGKGLEPTVDEVLPGCVVFSYKKTITDLYERDVDDHKVWFVFEKKIAQSVVLEGMRRWKDAHPKAKIIEIKPIGTTESPTSFLVRYEE